MLYLQFSNDVSLKVVKQLIEFGNDVYHKDQGGNSIMVYAASCTLKPETLKYFADLNVPGIQDALWIYLRMSPINDY
jgi:ankyrin repeat protein